MTRISPEQCTSPARYLSILSTQSLTTTIIIKCTDPVQSSCVKHLPTQPSIHLPRARRTPSPRSLATALMTTSNTRVQTHPNNNNVIPFRNRTCEDCARTLVSLSPSHNVVAKNWGTLVSPFCVPNRQVQKKLPPRFSTFTCVSPVSVPHATPGMLT